MKTRSFTLTLTLFILSKLFLTSTVISHRLKRIPLFYKKATVSWSFGLGIPVSLVDEPVTIGCGVSNFFKLPINTTHFWRYANGALDVSEHDVEARSINEDDEQALSGYDAEQKEKFQKSFIEAEIVENGTAQNDDMENTDRNNHLASMRWLIYRALADIAEAYGFEGRSCVLRSICEAAHTPFDYTNGILGEIFHVVMSPSVTNEETVNHDDNEYLYAEKMGIDGAPCEHIFSECKISIVDMFSSTFATNQRD